MEKTGKNFQPNGTIKSTNGGVVPVGNQMERSFPLELDFQPELIGFFHANGSAPSLGSVSQKSAQD